MKIVLISAMLMFSAITGFTSGLYGFTWKILVVLGFLIVTVFAAILEKQGLDAIEGVGALIACLIVNQLAYLVGSQQGKGE